VLPISLLPETREPAERFAGWQAWNTGTLDELESLASPDFNGAIISPETP
jgi:hypothetical protein